MTTRERGAVAAIHHLHHIVDPSTGRPGVVTTVPLVRDQSGGQAQAGQPADRALAPSGPRPRRYLSGESSALTQHINGRPALPRHQTPGPRTGRAPRPTLVQHVEPHAHGPSSPATAPTGYSHPANSNNNSASLGRPTRRARTPDSTARNNVHPRNRS